MKFKSDPNLGTRTINLPVVGDAQFIEGVVEIADEKVEEFLKADCGVKFTSVDGKVGSLVKAEGPEKTSNEKYPKASLEGSTVNQMREIFASLEEGDILTEEEKVAFKTMKKQEMIEFLYVILNSDRVDVEDEDEGESEDVTEEE